MNIDKIKYFDILELYKNFCFNNNLKMCKASSLDAFINYLKNKNKK